MTVLTEFLEHGPTISNFFLRHLLVRQQLALRLAAERSLAGHVQHALARADSPHAV